MRKYALLAGFAAAAFMMPASAATYLTSYTSMSGTPTTASFSITTSDALNARGGYDIVGVSGNVNGDTITGVIPTGQTPTTFLSPSGIWNVDNVFYNQPKFLDSDGMLFSTASGLEYNMWGTSDSNFTLASGYLKPNGHWGYGARSNGYVGAVEPGMPTPLASYGFDRSLAANEAGQQALAPLNPSGTNHFLTTKVFGTNEGVYAFDTNSAIGGGLTYQVDQNLVDHGYSVVMTVEFTGTDSDFKTVRLVDPTDATATYVFNVSNTPTDTRIQLGAWGENGNAYPFALNQWHKVAVTNSGDYTCIYFDGLKGICAGASFNSMDLINPDQFLSFLRNYISGEDTSGRIAALSIYTGALSERDALALTAVAAAPAPEPATWAMMLGGFGLMGGALRRRSSARIRIA